MRVVSLFSGIGMSDVGIKQALPEEKLEVVRFCENDLRVADAFCRLHDVSPDKNLGDIKSVDMSTLDLGQIDLLTSTFPCQSFSTAGKGLGFTDSSKGNLWELTAQMIDAVQPKVVILENVRGILSKKYNAMSVISTRLAGIGYRLQWQVMNAVDHGIPQARQRWIAVCLPVDKSLFVYPSSRPNNNTTVSDYIDTSVTERKIRNAMVEPMKRLVTQGPQVVCDTTKIIKLYDGYTNGDFSSGFTRNRIISIHGCSPTLTTTNDTLFYEVRGLLTAKERWALMGMPAESFEKLKLSDRIIDKISGNGVCTNVIEDIIKELRKQEFI
jgi:DNA-cytosine methyltransferase